MRVPPLPPPTVGWILCGATPPPTRRRPRRPHRRRLWRRAAFRRQGVPPPPRFALPPPVRLARHVDAQGVRVRHGRCARPRVARGRAHAHAKHPPRERHKPRVHVRLDGDETMAAVADGRLGHRPHGAEGVLLCHVPLRGGRRAGRGAARVVGGPIVQRLELPPPGGHRQRVPPGSARRERVRGAKDRHFRARAAGNGQAARADGHVDITRRGRHRADDGFGEGHHRRHRPAGVRVDEADTKVDHVQQPLGWVHEVPGRRRPKLQRRPARREGELPATPLHGRVEYAQKVEGDGRGGHAAGHVCHKLDEDARRVVHGEGAGGRWNDGAPCAAAGNRDRRDVHVLERFKVWGASRGGCVEVRRGPREAVAAGRTPVLVVDEMTHPSESVVLTTVTGRGRRHAAPRGPLRPVRAGAPRRRRL
ncbi:hypothetical protein BU14_0027s0011 [Porphyra umbilicalis]|uniref:Uncharacterized protein n=1 Tax=Porphyra umbilicalis TaxID=2786 RepID=A0A1X6PJL0_PORUM|nr:hypothetical protein BU14_0027s0011 [Porphyra umbilicalis]|eukprot:OSX80985.1 hypothetical protein BU14_0027s0011 [Porphyra umbilicalis]